MMKRLSVVVALCCVAAFGQDSTNTSSSPGVFRGSIHFGPQARFSQPVTGAPYSGEVVTETVQTLADGTHITQTMTPTKVYRDSSGRTRDERSAFRGPADATPAVPDPPMIIEIADPVAQARYILDTHGKVAHRQALPAPERAPVTKAGGGGSASIAVSGGAARVAGAPPATQVKGATSTSEELESKIIEGVLAEGTRSATTYPEGSMGNDRPIIDVFEAWRSPELQIPLLIKSTDPRWGERTERLTHLSRSEPDPSLFQPPPDYTVVDEKGDFTIKWGPVPQ